MPVVLDAHGEALRLGAAAGPAVVKPNLAELEDLAAGPLSLAGEGTGRPTVASAAAELRAAGAGLGRGLARPGRPVRRHPGR